VIRRLEQLLDRKSHRTLARTQDIDAIDFNGINNSHRPSDFRIRNKFAIDFFAQFRGELFGIVQTPVPKLFGQNCRGGNNRPSERTATSFVNSRDPRDSGDPEFFLEAKSASPVHPRKSSTDLREVTSDT
jgi:hypothetical protein